MTQQRSHFFLDVDDDVRLTQIFGRDDRSGDEAFGLRLPGDCAWISARVSAESKPRGFHRPVRAANRTAGMSTDLPGGESRRRRRVAQRLRLQQDALFVLRGVGATLGFGDHFGIRPRGRRQSAPALAAARRVGAAGYPAAPLTEPDLRASHPALWIGASEDQIKLVRDFHGRIRYPPEVIE